MTGKKKIIVLALVLILILAGAVTFGVRLLQRERVYSEYTILNTSDRADSLSAEYAAYGDGFIRYSRDGIAYYNEDNVAQWNTPYQLQNPKVDIRGDYCAAAGIGGSQIYVFNKNGLVMSVDTTLSIIAVSVSSRGYAAVILEDSSAEYIDMYDTTGEKVYHIKAAIDGNGTPMDISISDDGAKLIVSYATIEGNQIDTSIAFYNFGEVGKNEAERLVGGFDDYKNMLVPVVEFLNEDTAAAFGTGKVSIYTISQYPKLIVDIIAEDEIHGIIYSEKYIGLIYISHDQNAPYRICVYDLKGNKILQYGIEKNYKEYCFVNNNILMYDDNEILLIGVDGTTRFDYASDMAIDALVPISGERIYELINSRKIQKIRLE